MALGKGETRARLETIKADLRTISTCTDTTVAELQEFLGVRIAGAPQQENTRVQRAQLPTARRRAGTTATTTTDNVKEPESLLTPRERYVLATEAANITLKSLADALKTQPPAQARPTSKAKPASDAKAQKPARPRPPHTKSYSVAHPLKERSVSQVINSPRKPSSLRRSSSYSSFLSPGPDDGLVATAECARIAFAHLGTPEAVKVAGKDTPALQLENGCLALIGKLVAHGLDSLAAKEMRTLKRRLDKHLGRDDEKQATKPTLSRLGSQQLVEKESLATLLDFGELDRKDPALPIITNLQTYALRVIARSKRPRTVEAAWTHLKLSNPSSPANLIYHTAKSAENPAKSARQLESLAQTILLLCPSVSFPDDGDTLQVSPDIVLCLQHLAFRVRQRWWRLAKHQGNTEKELAEPFARCLLAFAKRSQLSPAKKYKLAENLHTDLFGSGQDEDKPQPNLLVSQTLSSFAQAAGLPDEALRYLGSSSSPTTQIPGAREAARLARIATVSLESCLKNGGEVNVDDTVAAILGALAGSLSGSATDLNALFLELHALRRVATRLLSANRQSQQESHFAAIERQCFLIIDASIKFSLRFISERPGVEADPKVLARQQERLAMALKLLKSGVDSVLACCRRPLTDVSEWGELDTLIQNCVRLVLHMEESPNVQDPQTDFQGVQGPLVKFSNGYWAIQLQLRKLNADLSLVATVMQQSVSLLQTRSLVEREAGVLTMKLERLGEILDQLERPKESREAYEQCARNFLSEAACQDIAEMASKHALQRMFEDATSSAALGRVLKAHHRSFAKYGLKRPDEVAFYDDEEHPVPVRGAMLEWQLALYQKTLSRNRQWDADLNLSIQAIGERLLGIYTTAKYPIRRQRVYLSLLQLSLAHPGILSELPACPQVRIDTPSDSGDGGLARFSPHLQALLTLKLCLQSASPSVAEIRQCFITWESIVDTARTWEEIVDQVDNVDYWLQEMQASVDCLSAKGEEYASLPVLRLLTRIFELRGGSDCSELVASLCTSGLQFLRLGYSGKGGLAFAKAEVLLSSKMGSTESRLIWHLGYAEYLLKIGNISKCESVLAAAHTIARDDKDFMDLAKQSTTLSGRLRFNKVVANACFVSSLLSAHLGNFKLAARHARQSVVLYRRMWAALETRSNARKAASPQDAEAHVDLSSKATFDPLSSMRTETGAPVVMSVTHDALDGAEFWPVVPSLYRALMQHSFVYAQQGLFQEAMYVTEQAEKVAVATNSSSLVLESIGQRMMYFSESGRREKAQSVLAAFDGNGCEKHLSNLAYHFSLAKYHHSNQEFDKELGVYDTMEKLVAELTSPAYIRLVDVFQPNVDTLADSMSTISLGDAVTAATSRSKAPRGRQPAIRAAPKTVAKTTTRSTRKAPLKSVPTAVPKTKATTTQSQHFEKGSISEQCMPLESYRREVVLRKVMASLQHGDLANALLLLKQIDALGEIGARDFYNIWVRFKAFLAQAINNIAEDFTFNSLPESTIAFPAMPMKARQSSEGVAKRPVVATSTLKSSRAKKDVEDGFTLALQSARDLLEEKHASCATSGSNHAFQQVSAALSQVTILLSAVSGQSRGLHPLHAAYMGEVAKCKSLKLAQESIEVEQENMSREDYLKWPEHAAERSAIAGVADFQRDYVDIIPKTWTAISLALNDEQNELFITRYESDTTPFILRLPLARHSSRDVDEEIFAFADGRQEFEKIIEDSDLSTRSAKDMTTREARLEWWEAREALDTQMHELLLNIENIWLGGFRGIFSQHTRQDVLLARFRTSLDNILNRHLPSRRKRGAQKKSNLDLRVLELFVGLGDASDEELDLDDALTDLIYFVVDILHFNGERNAYDEIDFDAMVIETLDALRAYHSTAHTPSSTNVHTILILDKNLHIFPWESLPCLEKQSISRLPSLAALRERLLAARAPTATPNAQPGHYISTATGGTSILNPSGDLTHTTKTIKPHLDAMHGSWTHIANRAPTEKEFEDSLGQQDLVLYFGHGSGAQFVRSKSVRRLYLNRGTNRDQPGCATTFLFGCSSVHLSDNGIYEPSGILASYLTAGAPAVVGMLWDVTDKDCDRFAVRVGELWGLWPEAKDDVVEPPPTVKKGRGKGKVAQLVEDVEGARGTGAGRRGRKAKGVEQLRDESVGSRECRRGVGLDEAVTEARKVCVLRYLNGAAAVVYGIPVYLE